MSDKPVNLTIQGTYKGYAVSVSLECSLDSLDKAINRLQARGIEPLPTAPASKGSSSSKGSRQKGNETLEGTVYSIYTTRADLLKFEVATGEAQRMPCVAFAGTAESITRHIEMGRVVTLEGHTKHDEKWGSSFVISRVLKSEPRQTAA
jgi:hypothetical protein